MKQVSQKLYWPECTLFFLILLFLPTQLGYHFWPSFAYVLGLRVDYLSPILYVTDILIGLLFLTVCYRRLSLRKGLPKLSWAFIIFSAVLITGIVSSRNPLAGVYGFVKMVEFFFFGLCTAVFFRRDKKNVLMESIVRIFSVGMLFEAVLAIGQFYSQGSLGGLLYFFGERTFYGQTPGIANASLNGVLILRPYGTFPHPNALAGYLVVGTVIVLSSLMVNMRIRENLLSWKRNMLHIMAIVAAMIALSLTMSRVGIALWFFSLYCLIGLYLKGRRVKIAAAAFLLAIGCVVLFLSPLRYRFFPVGLWDQAIERREELMATSLQMVRDHPLFGVGLNNFIVNIPYYQRISRGTFFEYLQPVHNIFLLIATETGLIGLGIVIWFIVRIYRGYQKGVVWPFLCLSIILVAGLFDHYFLTLQQGQLLLSFIVGSCLGARKKATIKA